MYLLRISSRQQLINSLTANVPSYGNQTLNFKREQAVTGTSLEAFQIKKKWF